MIIYNMGFFCDVRLSDKIFIYLAYLYTHLHYLYVHMVRWGLVSMHYSYASFIHCNLLPGMIGLFCIKGICLLTALILVFIPRAFLTLFILFLTFLNLSILTFYIKSNFLSIKSSVDINFFVINTIKRLIKSPNYFHSFGVGLTRSTDGQTAI